VNRLAEQCASAKLFLSLATDPRNLWLSPAAPDHDPAVRPQGENAPSGIGRIRFSDEQLKMPVDADRNAGKVRRTELG
jgi:hypothetical protein